MAPQLDEFHTFSQTCETYRVFENRPSHFLRISL